MDSLKIKKTWVAKTFKFDRRLSGSRCPNLRSIVNPHPLPKKSTNEKEANLFLDRREGHMKKKCVCGFVSGSKVKKTSLYRVAQKSLYRGKN
jgi:hypothetical protein